MTETQLGTPPTSGSFPISIDNEQLLVTGGQGTTTWTVQRAQNGSPASTHLQGASVDEPSFVGAMHFTGALNLRAGSDLHELLQRSRVFDPNTLTFTDTDLYTSTSSSSVSIDPAAVLHIDSH